MSRVLTRLKKERDKEREINHILLTMRVCVCVRVFIISLLFYTHKNLFEYIYICNAKSNKNKCALECFINVHINKKYSKNPRLFIYIYLSFSLVIKSLSLYTFEIVSSKVLGIVVYIKLNIGKIVVQF